jgi:hypothetical protein
MPVFGGGTIEGRPSSAIKVRNRGLHLQNFGLLYLDDPTGQISDVAILAKTRT